MAKYKTRPIAERFWGKVDKRGLNECWEWTACKYPNGYGQFRIDGIAKQTHRVAWELATGEPVPDGLCILHKCDNPPCVNPAHLFSGTQADNMRDMQVKGRRAVGENHGRSKLTALDVKIIRYRHATGGVKQEALASEYGMSRRMIHFIVTRQNWKHI